LLRPEFHVAETQASLQKEHSANIKEKPRAYPADKSGKRFNIVEFDCRGLEFVEFKADVSPT